jgi:putative heme transporter
VEPVESGTDAASWRSIGIRLAISVVALLVAGFVLFNVFDELDPAEVGRTLGTLRDAEVISLVAVWSLMLAAQGLLTASLVEGMPVRLGVAAFLAPAAVAMVIPGPSDLPLRYRMFVSWGRSTREAGLAIAAGGVFSIGTKLVLPVLAGVTLFLAGIPVAGVGSIIVAATLFLGAGIALTVAVLGSAERTERVSRRVLEPVWLFSLRLTGRRKEETALVERLLDTRADALTVLEGRWPLATWASFCTALATASLLLLCVRFMEVPAEDLRWTSVFIVFALVQGLTVVPITAGNVGVAEVGYVTLLTTLAGPENVNEIAAAVILFRLLTWLLLVPAGLAAFAVWRWSLRHDEEQVASIATGGAVPAEGWPAAADPAPAGGQGDDPAPAGGHGDDPALAGGQGDDPALAGGQGDDRAPADGQGDEPAPVGRDVDGTADSEGGSR